MNDPFSFPTPAASTPSDSLKEPLPTQPATAVPTTISAPDAPLPGRTAPPAQLSDKTPSPTNPVMAMLGGGVLACALIGFGMMIGGRGPIVASGGTSASTSGSGEQERIVAAVAQVAPAVMNVDTELAPAKGSGEFLPDPGAGQGPRAGKGTGVIIDRERAIMLTNAHVVSDPQSGAGAKKIEVTTRDGQKFSGTLIGRDRSADVAVVKLSRKPPAEAKLAPMKNGDDLQIGQWAIAIGNPFAQANTVTLGVVSAVGRDVPVPSGEQGTHQLKDMIQTDAAINPGNSGGPLCNIKGEVIGINTAIFGIGTGLGFSIPITKARAIADQLIAKGRVDYPFLGLGSETITDTLKTEFGLPDKQGVLVKDVHPQSPGVKAGVVEGDVLRALDGQPIKSADDLDAKISKKKAGDTVKIEIWHEGAKKTISLKLPRKPDDAN